MHRRHSELGKSWIQACSVAEKRCMEGAVQDDELNRYRAALAALAPVWREELRRRLLNAAGSKPP